MMAFQQPPSDTNSKLLKELYLSLVKLILLLS